MRDACHRTVMPNDACVCRFPLFGRDVRNQNQNRGSPAGLNARRGRAVAPRRFHIVDEVKYKRLCRETMLSSGTLGRRLLQTSQEDSCELVGAWHSAIVLPRDAGRDEKRLTLLFLEYQRMHHV